VRREFSDAVLIAHSIAVGAINLWKRMDIGSCNEHPKDRSQAT
jgi:hypothetical protein